MIYQIRKLRPDEVGLLENFLYEAIFIPEGVEAPPQDIIKQPELQVYVEDFGKREGDICFVAEVDRADIADEGERSVAGSAMADEEERLVAGSAMVDEEHRTVDGIVRPGNDAGSLVVGAVWVRIMNDYGHVDDETPSFAISLLNEYRNYGIGTRLMEQMLSELKCQGYHQASLAVQKLNYAVRMYQKVGFEIVDENEEEYIMICRF